MDKQQRSLEMETLARENGWKFFLNANVSSIPALQKFEFQTGEKRKAERIENLIEGTNFKIFDVYWQTEFKASDAFGPLAHKNMSAQNVRQQTFVLFESVELRLPKTHIYPANSGGWLDKIFRKGNFPKYPNFEKRWSIQGNAKDFFDEKLIEFYEKSNEFWTFADGNLVFIYQLDVLISPSQIKNWVNKIKTLANLLSEQNR